MQLSDWLDLNKVKRSDFAARVGVTPQTITGWCKGDFWIGKDAAQKVFDETSGAVTPNDFLKIVDGEAAQ